jgi:hypothetical protein
MVGVRVDAERPLTTGLDPGGPFDPDALFKEARRRRRRRRALMALSLSGAFLAAGMGLVVADPGSGRPPEGLSRGPSRVHTRPEPRSGPRDATPAPQAPPISTIGLADPEVVWAANATGLFVSTDDAARWRTVTPPNLADQVVSQRMTAVDAVGTSDLWVVLEDVIGLVPLSQSTDGSDRGEGIDRSTDGGRTWTFTSLPNCLQRCGPIHLSFVDTQQGFATVSSYPSGQPELLFVTQDGGATWSRASNPPDLGSVVVGGPIDVPQLVFTTATDGWAVTGPPVTYSAHLTNSGGELYRTTDGGTSWSVAPGLPKGVSFSLPTFFGRDDGVMLGDATNQAHSAPSLYVTVNGGVIWTRRSLPALERVNDLAGFYNDGGSLVTRFSAVSARHWIIDLGHRIYLTSDGGRHWASFVPMQEWSAAAATFSSPAFGVASVFPLSCMTPASSSHPPATSCYPTLVVSHDGGHDWEPAVGLAAPT